MTEKNSEVITSDNTKTTQDSGPDRQRTRAGGSDMPNLDSGAVRDPCDNTLDDALDPSIVAPDPFDEDLSSRGGPCGEQSPTSTKWNDAEVIGRLAPELLERHVTIAFGRNRLDTRFDNITGPFGHLLERLSRFERGEKDGSCMLQGALEGGRRVAQAMRQADLLLFDHDNGEDITAIAARYRALGKFAMLWTTHSHLKPETFIAEGIVDSWLRKQRLGVHVTDVQAEHLAALLIEAKQVKPDILAGAVLLGREFTPEGVKFRLRHKPMPRVRSLTLLTRRFEFANRGGTQKEAIQEWKERYAAFAATLGVGFDRSCADPARLMYTPRIPKDAVIGTEQHQILILGV